MTRALNKSSPNDTDIGASRFQSRVLQVPEAYDIALLGGRGGGKTFAALMVAARHIEEYGYRAQVLWVRRSHPALVDAITQSRELFGRFASFNASHSFWSFPNGAVLQFNQLHDEGDYDKYQGQSITLLIIDEVTQWPSPALLDRLSSNLRPKRGVSVRQLVLGNPGGVGHSWVQERFLDASPAPWLPFQTNSRTWIVASSTYLDNPHIDHVVYKTQLEASAPDDPDLVDAWLNGDWTVARGAFFTNLDPERVRIDGAVWTPEWSSGRRRVVVNDDSRPARLIDPWRAYLAHDYGTSSPSVTLACLWSPGAVGPDGIYYPSGSIIVVDELAFHNPHDLSRGLDMDIADQAGEIEDFAKRWHLPPRGFADDEIFSKRGHIGGSIADQFSDFHVYWQPAKKGRRTAGWARMRTMFAAAGDVTRPGLYVSNRCRYWWATVPHLPRSKANPEDAEKSGTDHAADATRYSLVRTLVTGGRIEL